MFNREANLAAAREIYDAAYDIDELSGALNDLRQGRITVHEYKQEVAKGNLQDVEPDDWDDPRLTREFPSHPLAWSVRETRARAASFFKFLAAGDPARVTDEALRELHISSRDAAIGVRFEVVKALGILGRSESIPVLEQMRALEEGAIQRAADQAISVISGAISPADTIFIRDPSEPLS